MNGKKRSSSKETDVANMNAMFVTRLVSHPPIGLLNERAFAKLPLT